MNRFARALSLMLLPTLYVTGGCTSPKMASRPAMDRKPISRLIQLNDGQWVDLSDAKEVLFIRADSAAVANQGADPFVIAIWHRGATDNPFRFGFSDEKLAYDSWKRLTAQLGGSLQEDDWKASPPAAAPPPPATSPVTAAGPPPAPPTLFTTPSRNTPYTMFRDDLNELAACRDEKLITPEEYKRAHDQKVADYISCASNGGTYPAQFGQMRQDLQELEGSRKDHVLGDDDIAAVHKTIVSRYIPAPQ